MKTLVKMMALCLMLVVLATACGPKASEESSWLETNQMGDFFTLDQDWEAERQRHAQPMHAGRYLDRGTRRRKAGEGVFDRWAVGRGLELPTVRGAAGTAVRPGL